MGYITSIYFKTKNKEHKKDARDEDDYIFVMCNIAHSKSVCKWVMDSVATNLTTLHGTALDTYEVITPHNMHLDQSSVVKAIGRNPLL